VSPATAIRPKTTCQQVAFRRGEDQRRSRLLPARHRPVRHDVVTDGELNFNGLRIIPDVGVQIMINADDHTFDTTGKVTVIAEGRRQHHALAGEIHVKLPVPAPRPTSSTST
jgi:hypothetical protein